MSLQRMPLSIASDHPAFAGHFPGTPIVPGVVLLDEALWAMGQANGADYAACRINSVKFLSPVGPGEPVSVQWEITTAGTVRFDILSNERRIATGVIQIPAAA